MSRLKGSLSIPTDDKVLELYGVLSDDNSTLQGTLSNMFLRGLSAYQEALMAGFRGTRDEWIESLQGRKVLLRENDNTIEWKYDVDTEWSFLISLEPVRDYAVLVNKPTLNGSELSGEIDSIVSSVISDSVKKPEFLESLSLTNSDIESILD